MVTRGCGGKIDGRHFPFTDRYTSDAWTRASAGFWARQSLILSLS